MASKMWRFAVFAEIFRWPAISRVVQPGRQHADGELRGGQIVGHIMAGDGVVNSTPAGRETVGDVDNSLKILAAQLGLMAASSMAPAGRGAPEGLDEIVRPGDLPGGQQMGLGLFRRLRLM